MVMTTERAEKLSAYLTQDVDKAKELLEVSPEEAVEKINADGYDFTADELKEYGEQLQSVMGATGENGEIDMEALDNVSGGVVVAACVVAAGVSLFLGGVTFGYQVARDRGW